MFVSSCAAISSAVLPALNVPEQVNCALYPAAWDRSRREGASCAAATPARAGALVPGHGAR